MVFFEVFRYLENSIQRLADTNVGKFYNPALMRAKYFQADLEVYYGKDWEIHYSPMGRACVRAYIHHLEELERTQPDLLIAYIYHLYLGLLSGGRILRRKQKLMTFSKFTKHSSVVDFEQETVNALKTFIKNTTNEIASTLTEEMKNKLLEESVTVFQLNCDLIRSVNSTNAAINTIVRKISFAGFFLIFIILLYLYAGSEEKKDQEL